MKRLSDAFDPRANGLNFVRLLLAGGVIVAHALVFSGVHVPAPFAQVVNQGFVDGFFAISGYLIVASWMRRPQWWEFLRARLLRILPAFYVCLVVTAFVLAPIGILVSGQAFPEGFWQGAAAYVFRNLGLYINDFAISGTPTGVVDPGWNGSLWTLFWEFLCYLAVLVLGVVGLLKRAATLPIAFALAMGGVIATSYGPIENPYVGFLARFGVMFIAGAAIYQFRRRIPVGLLPVAIAAAALVASIWLPDYRLLAPLPIAYLLLLLGASIRTEKLRFRNDVSYGVYIYAFPVQQILALAGVVNLGLAVYVPACIVLTLPLALGSWFLIEKPALRFKLRDSRPQTLQESVAKV